MENETLKQLVLAKCKEVWNNETNDPKASGFRVHSNDGKHLDVHNYRRTVHCKLSDDLTSEDNAWAIAADLLGIAQPVPFFDSQLRELCVALGWQGGTYHQVLAEVKRLKSFADEKRTESHC